MYYCDKRLIGDRQKNKRMNNHPKSKKSHSKSVFISKSLAVAFIAFYNRAEQSQSIVFLAYTINFTHPEKIKKQCTVKS